MKRFKSKHSTFNDGVLYICEKPEETSSFSAVKNTLLLSDLQCLVKLDFCEMSKRESDLAFAESRGRTLSLKVKTKEHQAATADRMVLIGDMLYSVLHIDIDRNDQEMFLYLEEVRRLS